MKINWVMLGGVLLSLAVWAWIIHTVLPVLK